MYISDRDSCIRQKRPAWQSTCLRLCVFLCCQRIKSKKFVDTIGFHSRAESGAMGTGAMEIMYYFAEQMMKTRQSFILENNFENVSKPGIQKLLSRYGCQAVTVRLSGDDSVLYERMARRNDSPDRHMGHIVNDCYPRPEGKRGVLSIRSSHRRTLSVESQSGAWWISGFRVLLWRLTPRIFPK